MRLLHTSDWHLGHVFHGHSREEDFDAVLARVKQEKLPFGSGPGALEDGKINHHHGGRGFYFRDPNGHVLEVITHTYV